MRDPTQTQLRLWYPPLAALLVVLTAACGSRGPVAAYPTTVSLSPAESAAPATTTEPLPALAVAQLGPSADGARRIERLEVVDQDLRLVVRSLAESLGLDYQLDPAVSGRVTTRLHDVTLQDALDALVLPHGYAYQLQGNVLRITPARLLTRIFPLDYVSVSRIGVGTTTIQRRLGVTNSGFGAGGGAAGGIGGAGAGGIGGAGIGGAGIGGGADFIQSVTVSDLWEEIRIALEGLVFDAAAVSAAAPANPAGGGAAGGAARAPGAFSRVDPDGRRLIINPMAGTVMVTAPPEKLEEVGNYIRTIEGSVQRQVLIEAKIVEVSLNRTFQFGIDWSMVQRIGNLNLRLGAGQGGAQFTIASGADPGSTIDIVLRALEGQGEVSVLSSPRVSVLNNQRATFNVTTDEVFFAVTRQPVIGPTGGTIGFNTQIQPQQVAVGITLDVLAQIAADNVITMSVRPVITDVVRVDSVRLEDGTQATAPVIDRRETDTVVRVRGGETIVIGGLMQTRRQDTRSGVPGLRNIPLIGGIFGGRTTATEKRELVIFITPRIVAGQPQLGR